MPANTLQARCCTHNCIQSLGMYTGTCSLFHDSHSVVLLLPVLIRVHLFVHTVRVHLMFRNHGMSNAISISIGWTLAQGYILLDNPKECSYLSKGPKAANILMTIWGRKGGGGAVVSASVQVADVLMSTMMSWFHSYSA